MSESKFNTFSKHITFSKEIYTEIRATGEDVIKMIQTMDSKTSDEILLKLLNQAVQYTSTIIYSLQEVVINSNAEELSNANLKVVIQRLSRDCNDLVQEYFKDSSVIQSKFQGFVQNLFHEAEGLFYVIKRNELLDFKHEIVEALTEILCIFLRTKIRIEIQDCTSEQLQTTIKKIMQSYFEELDNIKNTDDAEVLKNITIQMRHSSMHAFELAYFLNKVASNFNGQVQHKLLNSAYALNVATVDLLLKPEKHETIQEAVAFLKEDCTKCWGTCETLLMDIDKNVLNEKVANNLRNVVRHAISIGMAINIQKGKNIRRRCS